MKDEEKLKRISNYYTKQWANYAWYHDKAFNVNVKVKSGNVYNFSFEGGFYFITKGADHICSRGFGGYLVLTDSNHPCVKDLVGGEFIEIMDHVMASELQDAKDSLLLITDYINNYPRIKETLKKQLGDLK